MEDINEISKKKYAWLEQYHFKKGQSGNPGGRPKGIKSMKVYVREMLESMDDEERIEFLKNVNPDIIWKMGEGLPQQDITSGGEKINPIPIINVTLPADNINDKNTEHQEENQNCTGGYLCKQDNINPNILDSFKPIGPDTKVD